MKKKYLFLGVFAVIAIGAYLFTPSFEDVVKQIVHKYGSQITGTDVSLKGFNLSLTNGEAEVKELTVANPANYKTPYILELGGVKAKIDLKSLTSDTIIIEEISVSKPVITYEMLSLTQNNLKQLQTNIHHNTASAEKTEAADAAAPVKKETPQAKAEQKGAAKKVIIKLVSIKEGELRVQTAVPGAEKTLSVKLPPIEIRDIGANKNGGQSIAASLSMILTKIFNIASQTAVNSGLGDLKNVAKENLDNVVGGVKDRIKNIGIFGK